MPSLNDHFIENMIGKTLKFDMQPYERGVGTIKSMTPRIVKDKKFDSHYGYMLVEYEVYDVVISIDQGSSTGALLSCVPVRGTTRDTAGSEAHISATYGEINNAIQFDRVLIQARCG
jgi:hypothetical protein